MIHSILLLNLLLVRQFLAVSEERWCMQGGMRKVFGVALAWHYQRMASYLTVHRCLLPAEQGIEDP